ncbi:hypothetical protein HDF16_004233 [Granulicella aggregans]|uniref:Trypsin-like peptidase n=1 Tax=Granulicella aggregans TaxID=474949 RepID=A0A7W8E5C0_9BACT|nr:hypothetical protein [Granulicella aggregans]MBB5059507.1 hypothetical protein [Granulicella aggregans]
MKRLIATPRRRIATTALMLASFLEICGCNPVRTCEQLRLTRLSAIPLPTLLQQCAECLSSQEIATLRQAADGSIERGIAAVIATDETLEEALLQLRGPSFDSGGDASTDTWTGPGVRSAALDGAASTQGGGPIAWPISKSVLLIYDRAPGTGEVPRRIGTGFVLTVADPRHRQAVRFLVTARHVVDPQWASCGKENPGTISVRFNRWTGGVGYETIALQKRGLSSIVTSSDELTDLALIPLTRETAPHIGSYQLNETAFDSLPTILELSSIHPDQRIVTAGISSPKMSGQMDFPISDPGVLAAATSRVPVKVKCSPASRAVPIELWLIDASIPEHVSGAPVYAELARGHHGETQPMLVGIQSAVWPGKGVAGMTPVTALTDLVQSTLSRDEIAMNLRGGGPH